MISDRGPHTKWELASLNQETGLKTVFQTGWPDSRYLCWGPDSGYIYKTAKNAEMKYDLRVAWCTNLKVQ